jgi:hypothetical protein
MAQDEAGATGGLFALDQNRESLALEFVVSIHPKAKGCHTKIELAITSR